MALLLPLSSPGRRGLGVVSVEEERTRDDIFGGEKNLSPDQPGSY
jgi:hypothetical protein